LAAGLFVLFTQAKGTDGSKPEPPLPTTDCPDGLDCPPSEHASDKAKPPSSITAGVAKTRKMGPDSCASPFRYVVEPGNEGKPATSKCVLDQDAIINETLELSSFTTIDCQGHKLLSAVNGTNTSWPGGRSNPEVAIFLNGVQGVGIQNCVIENFDFGIFGVNSKVSADVRNNPGALDALGNRITQNTINARFVPVSLITFDNTLVKDNSLRFNTRGGIGINVQRDSDINQITNNNITGNFSSTGAIVRAPGPVIPTNPTVTASTGAFVMQTVGAEPTVLSAVVGGNLYQLNITNSSDLNENFSEDNLFEGNNIAFPQQRGEGVFFGASIRTSMLGNNISHSTNAIRAGGIVNRQFPGTCSLNSSRLCLANGDCNITGFDNMSKGNCSGLPALKNVTWRAINPIIEDNTLIDSSAAAFVTISDNLTFVNNTINGGSVGLSLNAMALEKAVITRNNVTNITIVLELFKTAVGFTASSFGSNISLNDFINYTTAVQTDNGYNFSSNLSVNGMGNYWGLPCPGFNASKVRFVNGTVNTYVIDNHPYNVSVANTPSGSLPAACS
jgi:hypothetical protein